jgi:nucleoside-diphosphate-sugar epimerase
MAHIEKTSDQMKESQLENKRILVTGASGFIGGHLVRRLIRIGAEVHAVSRSRRESDGSFRFWQADLCEAEQVHHLIQSVKPHIVFNLASLVTGTRKLSDVVPIFKANLWSTVNLMSAAVEVNCERFVQVGSMEEPEDGDRFPVPCSPYAAAKWAAGGYARMFHHLYGLPVVHLRVFMVYGPGHSDLKKLVPYLILSLLRKETPKLSSGQRQIDWIYVDDVVEALVKSGYKERAIGETIDIASGRLVTIRQLVELIVKEVDPTATPEFGALEDRPLERLRVGEVRHALQKLGWQARISLPKGLKKTVEWYSMFADILKKDAET